MIVRTGPITSSVWVARPGSGCRTCELRNLGSVWEGIFGSVLET